MKISVADDLILAHGNLLKFCSRIDEVERLDEAHLLPLALVIFGDHHFTQSGRYISVKKNAKSVTGTVAKRLNFDSYYSFILTDFFEGLHYGHYPRKCEICGKYFLMQSARRQKYCSYGIAPELYRGKKITCRKYAAVLNRKEKAENDDPIVSLYNRRCGAIRTEVGSYDDSNIRENTMYALLKTGRYDECLKLANETEAGTNPAPIYYAAAATLEKGDFDTSVDYVLELANQVKESEYPKVADELLHSWLALLVVDTETTNAKYSQLSESQISKLESDEFLKKYLEAYACAYYSTYDGYSVYDDTYNESLDKAIIAADKVIAIRGDICYPYYLKGVALAQQEKFEDAVTAYKKAFDYKSDDPMIWYSLYSAYAELEEWENAYTAIEIAIGQSPWFNYYNDYEGIGIHMYSYRDHAKQQIEKQHEASQKGENG